MSIQSIAIQRLSSQQLAKTKLIRPGDVLAWMGGLQAQDYAGAKWSIGLRLPRATDSGIEKAIDERSILRTWAMRGTLHFVSPADIRWMLELLAPRIIAGNARRYKQLELDERTFVRSNEVIAKALQGGKQLDRPALVAILERKGISAAGQRTPFLLQRAALDRLICQGVLRSNNPTYLLLDGSLPGTKPLRLSEALGKLVFRYFRSRGPATIKDFIWWSGLSGAEANAGLEAIRSKLAQVTVEGRTYWQPRSMPKMMKISSPVYLLPGFDEYLLSYQDRSASTDVKRLRSMTPTNGMLPPTIVINGRVAGTWKRTISNDTVVVDCRPFTKLSVEEEGALAVAVNRYGVYLGKAARREGRQ